MSTLAHLIYTSVETSALPPTDLVRLINHSRKSNLRHDLTGILLHVGNTFFQVLEGDPDVIESLYAKILQDSRHTRITRIIFEPIARRYFGDSLMNLATLTPLELAQLIEDGTPASRAELLDGLDEGRAKRLLRAFADGRWRTQTTTPLVAAPGAE